MDEIKKEYLRLVEAYEKEVIDYYENMKFKNVLQDIINNHSHALTSDQLLDAKQLLERIQKELNNY